MTMSELVRKAFLDGYEMCLEFMIKHKEEGFNIDLAIISAQKVLAEKRGEEVKQEKPT